MDKTDTIDDLPMETFLTQIGELVHSTGGVFTELIKDELPSGCPLLFLHFLTISDLRTLLTAHSLQLVLYTAEQFLPYSGPDEDGQDHYNKAFQQILQYQDSIVSYDLYIPYQGMILWVSGPRQPWAGDYTFAEYDYYHKN
jgi:hypothetical protein